MSSSLSLSEAVGDACQFYVRDSLRFSVSVENRWSLLSGVKMTSTARVVRVQPLVLTGA